VPKFTPRSMGPRTWGDEILIAANQHYTGKILRYEAGKAGGFQYHVQKHESFYLVSGAAVVTLVENGQLHDFELWPGETVDVPPLTPHQFRALTDCVVFEVSTPHFNDRVNVGEQYGRPDPPGTLPSTWSHEGDGHIRIAGGWSV